MKFLIDRCAGRRIADWLRQRGHDVVESRELGPDPGDRTLLAMAVSENRILITLDKDFGEFIFVEHMPHRGIIRLPDVPVVSRIRLLERLLTDHVRDLEERSVVVIRGGRIRIARPPDITQV